MSIAQITNGESGSSVRGKLNQVINLNNIFTCPENHGWDSGNSVTANTSAIQDAIDSGVPVFFGPKTYEVNSSLTIPDGATLLGTGFKTILYTQSNIAIVEYAGSNTTIDKIQFKGNDTGASQRGVSLVGDGTFNIYVNNKISNCFFVDLAGAGVYVTSVIGANYEGGVQVVNCSATNCGAGYHCDTRGEYNTFSNCTANNCTYGFRNKGGNNNWSVGSLTNCTYGLYLEGGTNDGHSTITGAKINHNTNNLYSTGLSNGYMINACHLYAGDIILLNSSSIQIFGSEFSTMTNFTATNSTADIQCSTFITNPTNYNLTGTAPTYFGCKFAAGIPAFYVNTIEGRIIAPDLPTTSGSTDEIYTNSSVLTLS